MKRAAARALSRLIAGTRHATAAPATTACGAAHGGAACFTAASDIVIASSTCIVLHDHPLGRDVKHAQFSGWWGALAGLAGGVLLTGAGTAAAAEARSSDTPEGYWQAALSSAQQSLNEAWSEAELDWQRAAAQAGGDGGTCSKSPPPNARPHAELLPDGAGLTVTIPIAQGANAAEVLATIDAGIDALSAAARSSSSSTRTSGGTGGSIGVTGAMHHTEGRMLGTVRLMQWELSRLLPPVGTSTRSSSSNSNGSSNSSSSSSSGTVSEPGALQHEALKVQVVVPIQPGSPHEDAATCSTSSGATSASCGHVSVVKPGGRFTSDELVLLSRLVAAANRHTLAGTSALQAWGRAWWPHTGQQQQQQGWGSLPPGVAWDAAGATGELLGPLLGGLLLDLQQQLQGSLEDMQRQLDGQTDGMVPPELPKWLTKIMADEQAQRGRGIGDGSAHGGGNDSSSTGGNTRHAASAPPPQPQAAGPPQSSLPLWQQPAGRAAVQQLQALGALVYLPTAPDVATSPADASSSSAAAAAADNGIDDDASPPPLHTLGDWGVLAGYEEQKAALEDLLLLPLAHPDVFERVAARTRARHQPGGARPRAVLLEGPPGTGKTTAARVLSRRAALPLVYVPLEALVSKWYGESEKQVAQLFRAAEALGGAVLFLDELDALATSRDRADTHEATRRVLGVLLREIDGFTGAPGGGVPAAVAAAAAAGSSGGGSSTAGSTRSVLIGATNRRQDLDAALLSRFSLSLHFGLPDEAARCGILAQYAAHLTQEERSVLARASEGFSGRDIRDTCESAERALAARIIRGQVGADDLPGLQDYIDAMQLRRTGAGRSGMSTLLRSV